MSNGCGCEKGILRYFKPPYARMFYVPCCMHDDDYDKGGDEKSRKTADKTFFMRMMKIIVSGNSNPWHVCWLTLIALLYYVSIRIFGRFYFNYNKD